jgi:choloylglycine hydrolase
MPSKLVSACIITGAFALSTISLACSNIFVSGPNNIAAVARTMDLELNTGDTFGFGGVGWKNTSNIDMPQKGPIHGMKWTNKYGFIGQSMFKTYVITDGMNSQGLYAAWLDLPDVSLYPSYNPMNKKPEIGIGDLTDYVLGTSKNVPEALANIKKTQPILDALSLKIKNKMYFGGSAVHLVLRDEAGNAAVVEWTKFKGKPVMHYYFHKAGTDTVVESMPNQNTKPIVFKNALGSATTNSPDYAWQLKNTAKYNSLFTGSTGKRWGGAHMNGSGMYGIPGSWTPPSRFARGTQLVRVMPKPQTENEAMVLAYEALETMITQIGTNPAASLWATMSDLHNKIYYFKPLLYVAPNFKTNHLAIKVPPFDTPWQKYDVKQLTAANTVPQGWIKAQASQGEVATKAQAAKVKQMTYSPTPGKSRATINWSK